MSGLRMPTLKLREERGDNPRATCARQGADRPGARLPHRSTKDAQADRFLWGFCPFVKPPHPFIRAEHLGKPAQEMAFLFGEITGSGDDIAEQSHHREHVSF